MREWCDVLRRSRLNWKQRKVLLCWNEVELIDMLKH
jgi:hypothetical protein